MKIELKEIAVKDLFNGYIDNSISEQGIVWSLKPSVTGSKSTSFSI